MSELTDRQALSPQAAVCVPELIGQDSCIVESCNLFKKTHFVVHFLPDFRLFF